MDEWELPIGVSANDERAGRMIVQRCARRGWRVPQDLAIIAGMNEEALCENPRPSLTSVEMGFERIGYEAARKLDEMMGERDTRRKAKPATSPGHVVLPPQGIVIRESTDSRAVKDELIAAAWISFPRTVIATSGRITSHEPSVLEQERFNCVSARF